MTSNEISNNSYKYFNNNKGFWRIIEALGSLGYNCLMKILLLMQKIHTSTCPVNESVTNNNAYEKISVCRRAEEGSVGDSWRAKITARNCSCRSLFRRFLRRGNYSHATRGNQRRQSRTGRELHWVHGRPGPAWPYIWCHFTFLALSYGNLSWNYYFLTKIWLGAPAFCCNPGCQLKP